MPTQFLKNFTLVAETRCFLWLPRILINTLKSPAIHLRTVEHFLFCFSSAQFNCSVAMIVELVYSTRTSVTSFNCTWFDVNNSGYVSFRWPDCTSHDLLYCAIFFCHVLKIFGRSKLPVTAVCPTSQLTFWSAREGWEWGDDYCLGFVFCGAFVGFWNEVAMALWSLRPTFMWGRTFCAFPRQIKSFRHEMLYPEACNRHISAGK